MTHQVALFRVARQVSFVLNNRIPRVTTQRTDGVVHVRLDQARYFLSSERHLFDFCSL